jgi:hypothetical protein
VKPENLPKANAVSEIWERWMEKQAKFYFCLQFSRDEQEALRDVALNVHVS